MTHRLVARLLLASAGWLGIATAPQALFAQPTNPPAARVDSIFAQYNHSSTPGCDLGVFRVGDVVYHRGYGMADLNQGIAIGSSTVFYIASTSKQFTAMSVALAAEQGLLRLDDPVRKWVPELPPYADSITVRNLVLHTSGIRDYLGLWSMSGRSSADEIPEEVALDLIARQRRPDFGPGEQWSYSNSGYFLLTVILKRASKMSFPAFAKANIFEPLGMASTHFHDDNTHIVPHRAEGYQPNGKGGFQIVRTSFALVGDGGLLTTVADLAKWDANFFDNKLGPGGPGLIQTVTTAGKLANGEALDYAFGLMPGTYRGLRTVRHGGSFIGFRAELLRFPDQRLSVAILCNDYTADPSSLADRVADLYLEGSFPKQPAATATAAGNARVPPEVMDGFIGRYEIAPGIVGELSRSGDTLIAKVFGQRMALLPKSDTVWVGVNGGEVRFGRGAGDEPTMLAKAFGMRRPAPRLAPAPHYGAAELAQFAGRYRSEELDTWFVVSVKDDRLRWRARWAEPATAEAMAPDVFTVPMMRVSFVRDRRGRVAGLELAAGRARGITAERVDR